MKRVVVGCALLAFLLPTVVEAVPITINFDNANQSVAAPANGSITITITGTITIDPSYHIIGVAYFTPHNLSHTNSLPIATTTAFNLFQLAGTGVYTGAILEITVPAGTPSDFYGYENNSNDLATFGIGVQPVTGGASSGAEQAYSVTVTNGTAVPEGGPNLLLLGLCLAAVYLCRRAFALRAWPTSG